MVLRRHYHKFHPHAHISSSARQWTCNRDEKRGAMFAVSFVTQSPGGWQSASISFRLCHYCASVLQSRVRSLRQNHFTGGGILVKRISGYRERQGRRRMGGKLLVATFAQWTTWRVRHVKHTLHSSPSPSTCPRCSLEIGRIGCGKWQHSGPGWLRILHTAAAAAGAAGERADADGAFSWPLIEINSICGVR